MDHLGTSDQSLAVLVALSRDLSRLFLLRVAGREISTGQLLIARSLLILVALVVHTRVLVILVHLGPPSQ